MRAPRLDDRYPGYAPEPTPVVPKWDALRYDRLPEEDLGVDHVVRGDDTTFQHWSTPDALWYLVLFSLGALVFTQAVRLVGNFLLLPALIPLWFSATATVPVRDYLRHGDRRRAGLLLVGIPLAFTAVFFTTTAAGSMFGRLLCLFVALLATGLLVDQLGDHAVALALARSPLPRGQKDRWRTLWARRFDVPALSRETRALRATTEAAGEGGRSAEEVTLLKALIGYQWGLVVLVLVWFVALIPYSLPLLLIIPPAFALMWVSAQGAPRALAAAGQALSSATESWLRYGTRAAHAPGVAQSPGGPRLVRLGLTAASLGLGAAALVPETLNLRLLPALLSGNTTAILWTFAFDAVGSWLVPLVVLASTAVAALGPVLSALTTLAGRTPPDEAEERRWSAIVETLRTSENPRVRRQLFVGFHAVADYPVFLPVATLREHAHILGATGSGKTSRAMLPLIAQLLRVRPEPPAQKRAADEPMLRGPLLVIDLKGDVSAFHAVRAEAERNGRPFKFLSNVTGLTTFAFNPLLDLARAGLTRVQIGETLRAAFNLEHGTGYGKGHYSAASRGFLADLIERVPTCDSFAALYRETQRPRIRTPAEKERDREATELLSTLKLLAGRPELNVTAAEPLRADVFAHRIDMVEAMAEDTVLYFHLQATSEEALVRYIASLALECFHTACARTNLTRPTPEKKPAYAFIDEFQVVAGRNVGIFMQQARSSGMALVLTNQAREDLPDEVRAAIEQNTAYRQYFTFRTPEALRYMEAIAGVGEEVHVRRGEDIPDFPSLRSRLSVNDLTAISADDSLSVIVQATSRDYSQFEGRPIVLRSPRHVTRAERDALDASPWPADARMLPVAAEDSLTTAPVSAHGSRPATQAASTTTRDVVAELERIVQTPDGYEVPSA